jgi:glycolate oxidase iron-sulfur subunit
MQTNFSSDLLADPAVASSEAVIRKCVHCGFCTATCPTYVLLGDELDSPRGRIYLMKEMLENQSAPSAHVVKHIDRCLSCLSCMTTCPSGVHYMHLVDHARAYIERRYRRPLIDQMLRTMLALVLPYPRRFRLALRLARLIRPAAPLVERVPGLRPLAAMLKLAPVHLPAAIPAQAAAAPHSKGRVALLQGCAEPVLRPEIRQATIRVLNRAGFDVIFSPGEVCCGALVHHMGKEAASLDAARRNVDSWSHEIQTGGLDAIVITTSGCGTTIKDYGHLLRNDPAYAEKAARVSALARDISELLMTVPMPAGNGRGLRVAYQAACSLQHGQKVTEAPKRLLTAMGYDVHSPAEAHLCCGSAGTYNIMQPQIAGQLGARKASHLDQIGADVIATGNIGCAMQIGQYSTTPVAHIVELLDWAAGGPMPHALSSQTARLPR